MGDLGTQTPLGPPPLRPSLPPGTPPRTTRLGRETQETPGEADPLQTTPQVKSENPKPSERPRGPREGPLQAPTHEKAPTEIPSFNPRVPPPQALQLTRQMGALKGKVAVRHLENRILTQGRCRRQRRRGGSKRRGRYGNRNGPWARRHGPQRSSAWIPRTIPTFRNHWWAWSVPSSVCCAQLIGYRPCASATAVFITSPSTSSSERQVQVDPTGIDVRCAS
jgi:hypothetical protein